MSEVQHTPEPWVVGETNPYPDEPEEIALVAQNGYCPAVVIPSTPERPDKHKALTEANARRIVACVNACAGIPVKTLEDMALRESGKAKTEAPNEKA